MHDGTAPIFHRHRRQQNAQAPSFSKPKPPKPEVLTWAFTVAPLDQPLTVPKNTQPETAHDTQLAFLPRTHHKPSD